MTPPCTAPSGACQAVPDPELIILGGGCAGLSLGAALAEAEVGPRTLILEPRPRYQNDRTWGYWAGAELNAGPFSAAEAKRWHSWEVRAQGEQIRQRSARYSYRALSGGAFYHAAQARIEKNPDIELALGESAQTIHPVTPGFIVETNHRRIRAAALADTRPPDPMGQTDSGLIQHFLGQEIESEHPVFDPECVTLMDFEVPQQAAIHFVYLLPFTPHRALVVDTWLSAAPFEAERYRRQIAAYLGRRFEIQRPRVLREESGCIPMSLGRHQPRRSPQWIHLGSPAGAVKASSGYAFLAIQRQVAGFAGALHPHSPLPEPPAPRAGLLQRLDRLFLLRLIAQPAAAPGLFLDLFRNTPPDALVRFLSDRPRPADLLAVMRALDAQPMLRVALKGWRQWI